MKTRTNWTVFSKLRLFPKSVRCQGYKPAHSVDLGCHSKIGLAPENFKAHLSHGGGFEMDLKLGRDLNPLWAGLAKLGLEIADLTCSVCQQNVPINVARIGQHLKPHLSSNRRMVPGGMLRITLSTETPVPDDAEAWEEEVSVDDAVREASRTREPVPAAA